MHRSSDSSRLDTALRPSAAARKRIRNRVMQRVENPVHLQEAQRILTPSQVARGRIWNRVHHRITAPTADSLLQGVRNWLTPSVSIQQVVQHRMQERLHAVSRSPVVFGRMKWIASFAMAALLIKLSPGLLLTSTTVAEAQVTLLPTRGEVSVYSAGLWQPVEDELTIEPGMRIRTDEGEASVLFRDDAVIRLDVDTIVVMHDISERGGQAPDLLPTLTLSQGRIWVQGLLPAGARGITVSTGHGHVTVNEGSISIDETDTLSVSVRAWDRRATVSAHGEEHVLVSGEEVLLTEASEEIVVETFENTEYQTPWPNQNLARDAVHRRHIAQLQRERRAASAGILPTSNLYSVKRVAEEMDMFMTLGEEAKLQKRLQRANTRLNEAAAMINEGGDLEQIQASLNDYRGELVALASGSGGDMASQFLIKQAVTENLADVSAALPGDESYLLKKAVFEASADLPASIVDRKTVETSLLLDTLSALTDETDPVAPETLVQAWKDLEPALARIEASQDIEPEIKREAQLMLTRLAESVEQDEQLTEQLPEEAREQISTYLPPKPPVQPRWQPMPREELDALVAEMVDRIYTYSMARSRENQLHLELEEIGSHREQGRILRALFRALPSDSQLNDMIRRAITDLRWQRAAEEYQERQRSAPSAPAAQPGSGAVVDQDA